MTGRRDARSRLLGRVHRRALSAGPGMIVVSATALIYGINQTMYRPLIAPFAVSLGASAFSASVVVAMTAVAGLLLSVPAGFLAQRLGEGWMLIVGGVAMSAAGVLIGLFPITAALLAGMGLAGVATVGIALSVHGLSTAPVLDGAVDTRRVAAFGIFAMVGQMVGPMAGGILSDLWGYRAAFWVVGVLGLSMAGLGVYVRRSDRTETPIGGTRSQDPTMALGAVTRFRRVLDKPGVAEAVVLSGLGTLLLQLRTSFLPLFLDQIGWSAAEIGLLLSIAAAAAVITRVVFPAVERRMPTSTLFGGSLLLSALGLALAVGTANVTLIFAATSLTSAMLGMINPVSLTLLSRLVLDTQRRLVLGVRITARNITQLVGPVVFGAIAGVATIRVAFLSVTVASAVATVTGTARLRRQETAGMPHTSDR